MSNHQDTFLSASSYFNHDSDRPVSVEIGNKKLSVTLADGRTISNPLDWHPWLRDASIDEQRHFELGMFSIDWPDLDEGLDIEGMLRGVRSSKAGRATALGTPQR